MSQGRGPTGCFHISSKSNFEYLDYHRCSLLQSCSTNRQTVLVPNDEHFNSCSLSLSLSPVMSGAFTFTFPNDIGRVASLCSLSSSEKRTCTSHQVIARRVAGIPKFGYHETPLKSSCKPFFSSCRCPLLYRVTPSGKWKRRIGLSFFLLSRQTTCRGLGVPPRRGSGHVLKLWEGGERETKFIPSPTSNFPVDCQCGRGEWREKFQHLMRFDVKILDFALLLFA